MMLLYVILMNGTIYTQDITLNEADSICVMVAQELRKSDKVNDAFCIIDDPNDGTKVKVGRREEDGKASN